MRSEPVIHLAFIAVTQGGCEQVYVSMADVRTGRMLLTKSVDLRGNTDDSWSRSLRYLVKNSVLTADIKPSGS